MPDPAVPATAPSFDSQVLPQGHDYFELRAGLNNSRVKFAQAKTGRVAFLGGSITYNPGWRDALMRDLQARFPQTQFEFIAAGIPSLGSVPHAFRLDRDVLVHGPLDLLFIEAAVNDTANSTPPAQMLRGMEGVVRHARAAQPLTDIVQMHFVMPEHLADYNHGRTPIAVAQHERVAEYYGNASLNLAREVTDRINARQFTWADDFRDLHPAPFGQQVYADSLQRMLAAAWHGPIAPVQPHPMPAPPLDPLSYFQGRFGPLEQARLGAGFQRVADWQPTIPVETRPGFVHVPALVATVAEAAFEFEFAGTGAGLLIGAGPDTGLLEVAIDGGPIRQLDTFTQWSPALYLPWAVMLADDLPPGHHHVRVKLSRDHHPHSLGTALYVFQLLEN